jgi:hypothetical protein
LNAVDVEKNLIFNGMACMELQRGLEIPMNLSRINANYDYSLLARLNLND